MKRKLAFILALVLVLPMAAGFTTPTSENTTLENERGSFADSTKRETGAIGISTPTSMN